ncbi:hypothetical protein HC256_009511 [Beauveria bassiana]|nr:hypothetical protein HC256_009511 [Beauveria bassiana]
MPQLIRVFRALPKELFRVNNGVAVKLRPSSPQRHSFDIHVSGGLVQAKALYPETYKAPNGASLRPNSPYQQLLVKKLFKGDDVRIYSIPKEANREITEFLLGNALVYTKSQWLHAYPEPTDFDGTPR